MNNVLVAQPSDIDVMRPAMTVMTYSDTWRRLRKTSVWIVQHVMLPVGYRAKGQCGYRRC